LPISVVLPANRSLPAAAQSGKVVRKASATDTIYHCSHYWRPASALSCSEKAACPSHYTPYSAKKPRNVKRLKALFHSISSTFTPEALLDKRWRGDGAASHHCRETNRDPSESNNTPLSNRRAATIRETPTCHLPGSIAWAANISANRRGTPLSFHPLKFGTSRASGSPQ